MWRNDALELQATRYFEQSARIILSLLVAVILVAVLAGTLHTLYDLRLILNMDFHEAVRTILVDTLTVLAVVEVLRTALAYFTEGRVKVTYIIDTVIVSVLTEVMGFWYRDIDWQQVAMVIALVVSLAGIRVIAVRFSPRSHREEL